MLEVKTYRKTATVEAVKYTGDDALQLCEIIDWANNTEYVYPHLIVHTLEGTIVAPPGCYIAKGIKGEVWPVAADIFESTYEEVETE